MASGDGFFLQYNITATVTPENRFFFSDFVILFLEIVLKMGKTKFNIYGTYGIASD